MIPTLKNKMQTLKSDLPVLQTKAGTTKRLHGRVWQTITKRIKLRDQYRCQKCGYISPKNEVDHIRPLEQGGSNGDWNLQTLCHECHAAKTAKEQRQRIRGEKR